MEDDSRIEISGREIKKADKENDGKGKRNEGQGDNDIRDRGKRAKG